MWPPALPFLPSSCPPAVSGRAAKSTRIVRRRTGVAATRPPRVATSRTSAGPARATRSLRPTRFARRAWRSAAPATSDARKGSGVVVLSRRRIARPASATRTPQSGRLAPARMGQQVGGVSRRLRHRARLPLRLRQLQRLPVLLLPGCSARSSSSLPWPRGRFFFFFPAPRRSSKSPDRRDRSDSGEPPIRGGTETRDRGACGPPMESPPGIPVKV